jgi:hypothetical protein
LIPRILIHVLEAFVFYLIDFAPRVNRILSGIDRGNQAHRSFFFCSSFSFDSQCIFVIIELTGHHRRLWSDQNRAQHRWGWLVPPPLIRISLLGTIFSCQPCIPFQILSGKYWKAFFLDLPIYTGSSPTYFPNSINSFSHTHPMYKI